jgi:hypothetical protein
MGKETDQFLDAAFWGDVPGVPGGDLAAIFTAPYTFVNAALRTFYGMTSATGAGFVKTDLDPQKRGGLLTQGSLMAVQASANQTSPVRRGQFVREHLLCQDLPPPPPNAMIELPALNPKLTTRERFSRHALDPSCSGCHSLMDPVGLGFENYDTTGRWRDTENGLPINASGEVLGLKGVSPAFNGALDLGRKLGAAAEVKDCVVLQWFRFGYGRDDDKSDTCSLDVLKKRFSDSGLKLRDLLTALTETDAFLYKRTTQGGAP